jgi:predicted TIM-barrel fold metal-dependent hydrolase
MKIIALEEHFTNAAISAAVQKHAPVERAGRGPDAYMEALSGRLMDLGAQRVQHMDATGIDVQVVSYATPGTQNLPPAEAAPLARQANDQLADAIKAYPDRLAGFATLPTPDPGAAAQELERAVRTLGFKGAMINGRTGARFLDDPMFRPILEAAVALDVPLYLHPTEPPRAVQDAYYAGFDPAVSAQFAMAGWGWHLETGVHALRLILAGVFDRYPTLQIILGHWGEMIPFYLARIDGRMSAVATHLQRPVAEYFTQHFYATPSGLFTLPPFLLTLQIVGADRIMYSVDYPFVEDGQARAFLENAPISPDDKEKIGHLNAERVLKLAR